MRIPGTYKYSALCTVYLKLVLVILLAIYSLSLKPSSASAQSRVLALSLRLSVRRLRSHTFFLLDRLLEGSRSLREHRPSKKQEGKEYDRVGLASLTEELAFSLSSSTTKGLPVASSNHHVEPTTRRPCRPFRC